MSFKKARRRGYLSYLVLLLFLIIFLLFSLFLSVSLGAVKINLLDTYRIVFSKLGWFSNIRYLSKSSIAIVWNMRVPRVLLAIIAGAGLSICGCVMQSTVNNPIAEPYILGISSGATFGATLSIILGLKAFTGVAAFTGALLATAAVLLIATIQGKSTTSSLILSGTVVNALFIAFANFIISLGANADSALTIKFWTMGSLAGASWSNLTFPAFIVSLSLLFFWSQYRIFNAMTMGEEIALTLGVPLRFYWYIYITIVAIITAMLVASCGIIGFVGLITPHLARALIGSNYKEILPIASLLGALFVLWADVFSRILIKNSELPIGIFTALVGAPFFIHMVAKSRKEVLN